jgi:hypothetical protein
MVLDNDVFTADNTISTVMTKIAACMLQIGTFSTPWTLLQSSSKVREGAMQQSKHTAE